MEPKPPPFGYPPYLPQRIHSGRGGRADRRTDTAGLEPGLLVLLDRLFEGSGIHRVFRVNGDTDDVLRAEPGNLGPLLDRGMCLLRRVDAHRLLLRPAGKTPLVDSESRRPFPGAEEGAYRRGRRRVLDHSPELLRQLQHRSEPFHHTLFELRGGRRRLPQHRVDAEGGGHELREDRRTARVGREISEKTGMLPVGDARHQHLFEILEDRLHRFPLVGWLERQPGRDLSRLHAGHDRILLGRFHIIGHPVDQRVAVIAEMLDIHRIPPSPMGPVT